MSDYYFDFNHWLMWKQLIWWFLTIIGFVSSLIAFTTYQYPRKNNTVVFTVFLMLGMLILLGYFPIEWGYSTDRENYAKRFLSFKSGYTTIDWSEKEVGFQFIQYFLSRFLNAAQYMFVIALVYLTNYYIAINRIAHGNSYWLFIAVVLSMGFVSYNLNTIRAGLAISFVVLALSYYKSLWRLVILLLIAASIHFSTAIPGAIIILCRFFDKTSLFFKLWIISIPVSFVAGSYFNYLFQGIGDDSRTSYLTATSTHYNQGFKINFIIYSLVPMAVGAYYILKKKFNDRFYSLIYNSYLLTNIFWILVIRANYSDRFAYLSWFMIPFVLVYPLLSKKLDLKEGMWLGIILLGENIFRMII